MGIDRIDEKCGRDRGVQPGDAHDRRLEAEFVHHPIGRPLQRRATDDGGNGRDGVAPRCEQFVEAGQGAERPDRHERIGRRDDDRFGNGEGTHRRCGHRRVIRSGEADSADGDAVAALDEVLLETDLALATHRDPSGDTLVGHRQQRDLHAECPGDLGGDLRQCRPLAEACGSVEVGGEILIAEVEPGRGR